MRIVTGHQPVYLPWLGLFHKIALADVFVFMDDVQYLRQDWNNRNRIKGAQGAFRLTVPVKRCATGTRLSEVRIVDEPWSSRRHWQQRHWRAIESAYAGAPCFGDHAPFFEKLYTRSPWRWLAELNESVLRYVLGALDVSTEVVRASDFGFSEKKSGLVLEHARVLRADAVLLGQHGRDYLDRDAFVEAGIGYAFQNYDHPVYPQRFGAFESHLSVIDLLFHAGERSRELLLGGNLTRSELEKAVAGVRE